MKTYEIVLYRNHTGSEELTLDALAQRASVHPGQIERFVEFGLIDPVGRENGRPVFAPSAVARVGSICRLRASLGVNLAGVAVILDLLDKVRALQRDNKRLSARR